MLNGILTEEVKRFVKEYEKKLGFEGPLWGEPLFGAADVRDPYIRGLRENAEPEHQLPEDVLDDAKTVLVWYVPFSEAIVSGNCENELASAAWAQAYELTNAMLGELNLHIIEFIREKGYDGAVAPGSLVFDREKVISHWSHRHLVYAAGLGTFGINNMIITKNGCSGRCSSIVTNIGKEEVETGRPLETELCAYKRDGSCGICADRCVGGALTREGFDRHKCFEQCSKNAEVHKGYGSSYGGEDVGSEVCGKCLVGLPCSLGLEEN